MTNKFSFSVLILLIIVYFGKEIEARQKYNTNEDFLLHESQGAPNTPKQGFVDSQFPPLPSPSRKASNGQYVNYQPIISPDKNQQPSSGKRDYVASQRPTLSPSTANIQPNPQSGNSQLNGKTDVVPPPKSSALNSPSVTTPTLHKAQQSNGKRDYVNPLHSNTPSPLKPGTNVKDLINFYDKDTKPQNPPSYSSILSGKGGQSRPSNGNNVPPKGTSPSPATKPLVTPQSAKTTPSITTKPISFSSVVAGNNKPGATSISTGWGNVFTTPKPTYSMPLNPTTVNKNLPTQRPLPSSFVNNNNNQVAIGDGPTTDAEIKVLSEELLRKDSNNAAKYITINYQEKTNAQAREDRAPSPLFVIPDSVWNIPTIQKIVPLLDNYERDTLVNEYVTPQEKNEENYFMDAIMSTAVIRHLMNFLKVKGVVTPDPKQQRDYLKQLWFSLYSRGKGKISSSGFEHIFVSELKNGEVSGLHNWIYFAREEAANRVNYLGYLRYAQLNDKGAVLRLHFNQLGVDKPVDSMFVGTSPELEIALYTLCFVTRADKDCILKLGGKDISIVTHTFRYRSKNLIGSAYPQIL